MASVSTCTSKPESLSTEGTRMRGKGGGCRGPRSAKREACETNHAYSTSRQLPHSPKAETSRPDRGFSWEHQEDSGGSPVSQPDTSP